MESYASCCSYTIAWCKPLLARLVDCFRLLSSVCYLGLLLIPAKGSHEFMLTQTLCFIFKFSYSLEHLAVYAKSTLLIFMPVTSILCLSSLAGGGGTCPVSLFLLRSANRFPALVDKAAVFSRVCSSRRRLLGLRAPQYVCEFVTQCPLRGRADFIQPANPGFFPDLSPF